MALIKRLNNGDIETAEQIVALQKKSYMIEARLMGFYGIPTLNDTIETVRQCDEAFYGYYEDGVLAGFISYKLKEDWLDICRVAVHPEYFRRGIAKRLVTYIEGINKGVKGVIVSTGVKNEPAVNLYLKLGFRMVRETEVAKGIYVVFFKKLIYTNME